MKTINTQEGTIQIYEPSATLIKDLQSVLPYGLYPFGEVFDGAKYGLVVQCDNEELKCLKLQSLDIDKKTAQDILHFHHILILEAYLQVKDSIGDSIYYATPYHKDKGERGAETGVAHFVFPHNPCPDSKSSQKPREEERLWKKLKNTFKFTHRPSTYYDQALGEGATYMIDSFLNAFFKAMDGSRIGVRYVGKEIRPKSQLGGLDSGFMLYKGQIIYLGSKISNEDSRMRFLAHKGITQIIHMPSAPMQLSKEQCAVAKGEQSAVNNTRSI